MKKSNLATTFIFVTSIMLLTGAILSQQQNGFATSLAPANANTEPQVKPGTLILTTFENGMTKVIRSNRTDVQAIDGGLSCQRLDIENR